MTTATEGNTPAIDVNQQEYIQYTISMDQASKAGSPHRENLPYFCISLTDTILVPPERLVKWQEYFHLFRVTEISPPYHPYITAILPYISPAYRMFSVQIPICTFSGCGVIHGGSQNTVLRWCPC